MKYDVSHLLPVLLVLVATSTGALSRDMEEGGTVSVAGDPRAVIAFLPPSMRDPETRGAAEAQASVRSAIESTRRCLGEVGVSYHVVFADRIAVRLRERDETFDVGDLAPLVGALLIREDSNVRIMYAGGGPEALPRMLRSAAGRYFGRECPAR